MAALDDEDIIDGSDEEQEDITPADILHKLKQSWIDETRCPELLEYDGDVVDCMLDQIHQMEANLRRVSKTDFKISIHKMEVDRIRYMIASYLRCRLQKIELYHRYLLSNEEQRRRLSPAELKFATERVTRRTSGRWRCGTCPPRARRPTRRQSRSRRCLSVARAAGCRPPRPRWRPVWTHTCICGPPPTARACSSQTRPATPGRRRWTW
ncbi:DNA replication complex GINS protein SLD5-like isoform X2 [Amphibalanus amphitrite]|uniref:DNA replication complex GINS protein SLD5-like isoform X2 n=1 Tax=Amphibalanus amphitrite TaxID=1232801 RepID=UPI001C8FB695|nr:DNA replication complex GINS protein SLD5-like isoform X2 [Amphibalanus amphitrite]XP_043222553.1 DNA replication complex GINS protein SLD5-like isoform X2 [Amphibalanus amphitrite]XP_043222554.1 DNA replication complex GINS protein SLD5-like isoform X2 [Amphibalanus amphitrite]